MKFWQAMNLLCAGEKVSCSHCKPRGYIDNKHDVWVNPECVNSEWELYEKPQPTFSFLEMIKGLKEGKKFRRLAWTESDDRIFMKQNGKLYSDKNFNIEEYEAIDWVEIQ